MNEVTFLAEGEGAIMTNLDITICPGCANTLPNGATECLCHWEDPDRGIPTIAELLTMDSYDKCNDVDLAKFLQALVAVLKTSGDKS